MREVEERRLERGEEEGRKEDWSGQEKRGVRRLERGSGEKEEQWRGEEMGRGEGEVERSR